MGGVKTQILTLTPWEEVQIVEEVWSTFGPNLAPMAPEIFFGHTVAG